MSQAEVARLAQISARTYREWESGRRIPNMGPSLRAVAVVLRTSVPFLLIGEENYGLD